MKICSKSTGEQPCGSATSLKLLQQIYRRTPVLKRDFTLAHGCSPVDLLHIFRTSFFENTSGRLLLVNQMHLHKGSKGKYLKGSYFLNLENLIPLLSYRKNIREWILASVTWKYRNVKTFCRFRNTQSVFTCSKLTIEADVQYAQS